MTATGLRLLHDLRRSLLVSPPVLNEQRQRSIPADTAATAATPAVSLSA